jgi:hypothetical protein
MVEVIRLALAFGATAAAALCVVGLVTMVNAPRTSAKKLLGTSIVHALMLFVVLVLWFNARPGFFDANKLAYDISGDLRRWGGPPDPLRDQGAGLVLVDNSANKAVVPPKGATMAGRQQVAITDRAMLAELLRFLAGQQDRFSLVVCDIVFEDRSPDDEALADAINALAKKHKILLAHGNHDNTEALRFSENVLGRATESLQGELIAAHNLFLDGEPSLPCLMYERITGARLAPTWAPFFLLESGGTNNGLAYPAFPAALDRFDERCTRLADSSSPEGQAQVSAYFPFSLGYAVSEYGKEDLLAKLDEQAVGARYKPIVVVGEFSPPLGEHLGSDVHRTFSGMVQGSTIIIDLYLEMLAGAHRIPLLGSLIVILLLTGLSLLVFSMPWTTGPVQVFSRAGFWSKDGLAPVAPQVPAPVQVVANGMAAARTVITHVLKDFMWEKLKELLPLLIFLALFLLIDRALRVRVNLAAFLLYFIVLQALFRNLDLHPTETVATTPPAS